MPSPKMQDYIWEKAEQTLLDAIQAGNCNNKHFRNVWDIVLEQYLIYISEIVQRKSPSISEGAAGIGSFPAVDTHLPPSVSADPKCSGSMQGFRIYMDQEMYDLCRQEQGIIAYLLLIISKLDMELFDKLDAVSSMHELYEAYPRLHSVVDTIGQALRANSAF